MSSSRSSLLLTIVSKESSSISSPIVGLFPSTTLAYLEKKPSGFPSFYFKNLSATFLLSKLNFISSARTPKFLLKFSAGSRL